MAIRTPLFAVPLNLGTVTGSGDAGFPASNLGRHKALGLKWQSTATPYARGDFGSAKTVDFCAILSANAQVGTTFRLRLGDSQAEVDGTADYDSGAQTFISPAITREDGLYHSFWELPSAQTKRWWRIDIGSHSGAFEAPFLVLGSKINPARFYDYGFEYGIDDLSGAEFTRLGIWDETPGTILRTVSMTFNWQTEAEWEGQFRPMIEKVGTSQPVYCCFDPEATTYRQNRTYFGKFDKAPFATGRRKPGTFGGEYTLSSLV